MSGMITIVRYQRDELPIPVTFTVAGGAKDLTGVSAWEARIHGNNGVNVGAIATINVLDAAAGEIELAQTSSELDLPSQTYTVEIVATEGGNEFTVGEFLLKLERSGK
jgi:hypothetical protein